MDQELDITPRTLQQETQGSLFPLIWLVLSALLWGMLPILFLYIPLGSLELLLPKTNRLRQSMRRIREEVFTGMIKSYLRMQPWYRPEYCLEELTKIKKRSSPQGILLISNHRSHLDVFLFLSQVKGIQVLARESLFKVPVLNLMMKLTRQIPAQSGNLKSLARAAEIIRERLRSGESVLIFPEFTRCPAHFCGVQPFSLLPFQIAVQEKVAILPLVVTGTDEAWPRGTLRLKRSSRKQKIVALPAIEIHGTEDLQKLRDFVQHNILTVVQEEYRHEAQNPPLHSHL